MKLSIRDSAFGHSPVSNGPTPPIIDPNDVPIVWDRDSPAGPDTIYTDGQIRAWVDGCWKLNIPFFSRIWLIEPNLDLYDWVIHNQGLFSEIWTASRDILENVAHARFLTNAGCWIRPEDRKIWPKTKGVSQIASSKRGGGGYNLRHLAARMFSEIDTYGSEYRPITPTWNDKIHALRDYRFSLVIENCRRDYFFTEKLIDCFMTGTVPIYWGCPSIENRFNKKGIMIVEHEDPIASIRAILAAFKKHGANEWYSFMAEGIADNFERAKRYVLTEDFIAKNLLPQ